MGEGRGVFPGRAPGSYHLVFPKFFRNSQNKSCLYDSVIGKACSPSGKKILFPSFDLVFYLDHYFGAGRSCSCREVGLILGAPERFVVYRQHYLSFQSN